jgi:hypothetical protein
MEEKIDKAIEILAGKIVQPILPDDALKYTQAALNLAQVKVILKDVLNVAQTKKRASAS